MKDKIILYDFDGTIYKRDSFLAFLLFAIPSLKLVSSSFLLWPTILKMKLGLKSKDKTKEYIFSYFFKGMDISQFNSLGFRFQEKINIQLNNTLIKKIEQNSQFTQIIVSASISNWIVPWAKSIGIDAVIATEILVDQKGKITGEFATKNCNNEEKVFRTKQFLRDQQVEITEAYGNSKGDYPMLKMAQTSFLIKRNKLEIFK